MYITFCGGPTTHVSRPLWFLSGRPGFGNLLPGPPKKAEERKGDELSRVLERERIREESNTLERMGGLGAQWKIWALKDRLEQLSSDDHTNQKGDDDA